MTRLIPREESGRRRWLTPVAVVAAVAVVMGLRTLGGGFVGSDDHRLLLDHVLVNHPSFEHALKLFTMVHRDLYQPLPLLSFQLEFGVASKLGLFDEGLAGGARLFHLTNVLLHAANAVLVWFVVRMLGQRIDAPTLEEQPPAVDRTSGSRAATIATIAALFFAVHPIQAEVVAWTNGRMMLMSTLFGLLSLLTFAAWLDRPRIRWVVLTIVMVLFCAISKVRIGLPVLLFVVFMARRVRPARRVIFLWLVCAITMALFVVVNVRATSGAALFADAAEHLRGPRSARVILALANYIQHLVWPVGLASYYPTPPLVRWSDPETVRAAIITFPVLFGVAWGCLRSRALMLGSLWFASTIAATLPLIPARNILAADRYMYLPIIGLLWAGASIGFDVVRRLSRGRSSHSVRVVIGTSGAVVMVVSVAMCWHIEGFYSTPMRKTQRIATLNPETPRVWERVGWTLYRAGRYDEAIEAAEKELRHDSVKIQSGAHQLIGMAELRRGNEKEALERLHFAIDLDPDSTVGLTRIGRAYEDLGNVDEAVRFFEAAVAEAPLNNPTLNRLARLYRQFGRRDDARAAYEQQLRNNPYEVPASMGLAELDIEEGAQASYRAAETRLRTLLEWMPENTAAMTNLGAVLVALGRPGEAVEVYQRALGYGDGNVTAALNLANLYRSAGNTSEARRWYEQAVAGGLVSVDEIAAVHDFLVSQGEADRAVALWRDFNEQNPESIEARAFLAWAYALAGSHDEARTVASGLVGDAPRPALASATLAYLDFVLGQFVSASQWIEAICDRRDESAAARKRLLGALERLDQHRPGVPWTYCLVARLVMPDGNLSAAEVSIDLCEQRCADDACRSYVHALRSELAQTAVQEAESPPLEP